MVLSLSLNNLPCCLAKIMLAVLNYDNSFYYHRLCHIYNYMIQSAVIISERDAEKYLELKERINNDYIPVQSDDGNCYTCITFKS